MPNLLAFAVSFVLVSIILDEFAICQQVQLQSEFRITKATECNTTGLTWHIQNISISYQYPRTYLNADFNITQEIKHFTKMYLYIERCNDQGFNCEDFQVWRIEHFCNLISWRNQIWSSFVDSIHPSFRCPVKKMIYELRNATFDINAALKWYPDLSKYRWKGTCKVTNEHDTVVYCAIFELHMYQYRKRNRKPSSSSKQISNFMR